MKWAIDRIEDNIVILENISTGDIKEVNIDNLPSSILEENILIENNGTFLLDKEGEEQRRKIILEKFQRLRNK